jgi:hypothetical protein
MRLRVLNVRSTAVHDYKELAAESERRMATSNRSQPQITFMAYMAQCTSDSKLVQIRLRLLKLLQRSRQFDPKTVLEHLKSTEQLQLERAILYGKVWRRSLDYSSLI